MLKHQLSSCRFSAHRSVCHKKRIIWIKRRNKWAVWRRETPEGEDEEEEGGGGGRGNLLSKWGSALWGKSWSCTEEEEEEGRSSAPDRKRISWTKTDFYQISHFNEKTGSFLIFKFWFFFSSYERSSWAAASRRPNRKEEGLHAILRKSMRSESKHLRRSSGWRNKTQKITFLLFIMFSRHIYFY